MFKKNICDGIGSRNKSNGTPLYPPLFWLDNIFKYTGTFKNDRWTAREYSILRYFSCLNIQALSKMARYTAREYSTLRYFSWGVRGGGGVSKCSYFDEFFIRLLSDGGGGIRNSSFNDEFFSRPLSRSLESSTWSGVSNSSFHYEFFSHLVQKGGVQSATPPPPHLGSYTRELLVS